MLFQEGMLLGWLRVEVANYLDERLGAKRSLFVQKPLWECIICMASIWTIILTLSINIPLIFVVCGINTLIDKFINYEGVSNG